MTKLVRALGFNKYGEYCWLIFSSQKQFAAHVFRDASAVAHYKNNNFFNEDEVYTNYYKMRLIEEQKLFPYKRPSQLFSHDYVIRYEK